MMSSTQPLESADEARSSSSETGDVDWYKKVEDEKNKFINQQLQVLRKRLGLLPWWLRCFFKLRHLEKVYERSLSATADHYMQEMAGHEISAENVNYLVNDFASCLTEAVSFLEDFLGVLNVNWEIVSSKRKKIVFPKDEPVIVVANHPYGCVDGLALLAMLREMRDLKERDMGVKLLAGYAITHLPELGQYHFDIDSMTDDTDLSGDVSFKKEIISFVDEGNILAVFPAFEEVRFNLFDDQVIEPAWREEVATIIQETKATVVPVFINYGRGLRYKTYRSSLFVNILKRLRVHDIQSFLFAKEMLSYQKLTVQMRLGDPIPYTELSKEVDRKLSVASKASKQKQRPKTSQEQALMDYLKAKTLALHSAKAFKD